MSARYERSDNKAVLTLEGELTLPHAEELRGVLMKALLDADAVSIAIGNVQDMDLSTLQLLCSAHRCALRLKKQIAFSGDLSEAFREAVEAAGYARITGCKLDSENSCLWAGMTGVHHG
jgi:anti-anti-sigma regulatory factor